MAAPITNVLDLRCAINTGDGSTSKCKAFSKMLLVDVRAARNLPKKMLGRSTDASVHITVAERTVVEQSWQSRTIQDDLNPQFDESHVFLLPRDVMSMRVRVMSGSSSHIATLDINFSESPDFAPTSQWLPLEEGNSGELHMGWCIYPLEGLLSMPAQLEMRARDMAEAGRQHELTLSEKDGRIRALESQLAAAQGSNATEAISQQNTELNESNAHLGTEVGQLRSQLEEANAEIERLRSNTISARAQRAAVAVTESVENAVNAVQQSETYHRAQEAAAQGAAQAKAAATAGMSAVRGMFAKDQSAAAPAADKK